MIKPRIVAIDDEANFIDMLENYFVPRGYDISFALKGVKGIELIREKKPDIVLMDLKMPGVDGDEILKMLGGMIPRPKVIFVTAYDDGGKTKARLIDMGAQAFFEKPLSSLKTLEEAINNAVK